MPELVFQRLDDAVVLRHAAGHHHAVTHAHAVAQAAHAPRHRAMNARDDVALVGPDGELRDDLALGEDRAGRADADLLGGLVAEVAEVLDP